MHEYQKLLVRAAECRAFARKAKSKIVSGRLKELAKQFENLAGRAKALEIMQRPLKSAPVKATGQGRDRFRSRTMLSEHPSQHQRG